MIVIEMSLSTQKIPVYSGDTPHTQLQNAIDIYLRPTIINPIIAIFQRGNILCKLIRA